MMLFVLMMVVGWWVLPIKNGVGASCVVVGEVEASETVLGFLCRRFPKVGVDVWQRRLAAGQVVTAAGESVGAEGCAKSWRGQKLYYYREVVQEVPIPFEAQVVFENEHILVADKPHFLPVVPSGQYLQETLLVRLRQAHNLPDLAPLHRLDKDTAGLVMFAKTVPARAIYHALFRERRIHKTYEAIAPWRPEYTYPFEHRSHLAMSGDFFRMTECLDLVANAHTRIDVLAHEGAWARYQLCPISGKRHQLRVHMAALGMPLLHDGYYPEAAACVAGDYTRPLQLLARRLQFTDPVSGQELEWVSGRSLLSLAQVNALADN